MQERLEESQESVQDLAPVEQPVEETEPVAAVDPETRVAELEAQVAKLQNDLRSKDGQRRKESDRDAELTGFKDELSAMRKVLAVTMESIQRGDTEGFQEQISRINQEAAEGQATRDWNSRYDKEQARLISTVQDEDGNLLISEDDAQTIQAKWNAAWQKAQQGNYDDVYDTQIEAQRMVNQEERRRAEAEKKALRDEAKTAGKKALEKAGIADLDTGAAIAGGNEELSGTALIERGLRMRQNRL